MDDKLMYNPIDYKIGIHLTEQDHRLKSLDTTYLIQDLT